jgi:hypothetical protein
MNHIDGLCFGPVLLSATLGCSVFDASLIPQADASTPAAAPDGGPPPIELSESCEAASSAALVAPSNARHTLELTAAAARTCGDHAPGNVSCLVDPQALSPLNLTGRNFYFPFMSSPSRSGNPAELQKWHVHASNISGDVALYVLGSCAGNQQCVDERNGGIKTETGDEHLSFQVLPDTRYIVVVNSTAVTPGSCDPMNLPTILFQHDVCGDGDPSEHGKACDDQSSATCVACKRILPANTNLSGEPNDSPLDANIIPLGSAPYKLEGRSVGQAGDGGITGIDPYDFFGLQALSDGDPSGNVTAAVTWTESTDTEACQSVYLAAIDLSDSWFLASDTGHPGLTTSMVAPAPDEPRCKASVTFPFDPDPTSTPGLSSYFIRVAAKPGTQVSYGLSVTFKSADH